MLNYEKHILENESLCFTPYNYARSSYITLNLIYTYFVLLSQMNAYTTLNLKESPYIILVVKYSTRKKLTYVQIKIKKKVV